MGSKQPIQPKLIFIFESAFCRIGCLTSSHPLHSNASPVPICFSPVSCCSFTRVAHGGSEQQPNSQPYTTRCILTFLTGFVKKKERSGVPLPPKGRELHTEYFDEKTQSFQQQVLACKPRQKSRACCPRDCLCVDSGMCWL